MASDQDKGEPQEKALRSGKQYGIESFMKRRPSTSGAPGAAATPQEKTKVMSEEALSKLLGKINDSLDQLKKQGAELKKQGAETSKQVAESSKQVAETNKTVAEISGKIDINTKSIIELGNKVNSNTEHIGKLLEETSTIRKIAEEAKEIATATDERLPPVVKKLEDHDLALSMIEMQRKERNLRIRAIPESEGDNLVDYLTKEFSEFWQKDLEKEEFKIESAFRLGIRQRRNKPRDCLITLRSKEERDKILDLHYQRTLQIEDSFVEIFKDIPKQILDARSQFRSLVVLLKRNSIPFRWEFPQGLSFKYKGKKRKIKTVEDKDKFLHQHEEDLRKGAESGQDYPGGGTLDKDNLLHRLKPPTEEEELLGATGGEDK